MIRIGTLLEINYESGPIIISTGKNMQTIKYNKANDTELIAEEIWKALSDGYIDTLMKLCNEIHNTGNWPNGLKEPTQTNDMSTT